MDSDSNFGCCQNPDVKCGFWHQKLDAGTDFGSGKWIQKIAFGMPLIILPWKQEGPVPVNRN